MTSTHDLDAMPLPVQRTKRRASVISPIKPTFETGNSITTPTKRRASKRVRFSGSDVPSTLTLAADTTGLTPAVSRANLRTPKSKRPATPRRAASATVPSTPSSDFDYRQFTPFRQALDERCKRRIRRNHLSEELNRYEADKKTNTELRKEIADKNAELEKLRAQLKTAQYSKRTIESDGKSSAAASRFLEVEEELDVLRRSFNTSQHDDTWDHIPRNSDGPGSEGGDTIQIYEDEADPYQQQPTSTAADTADAVLMGLELESARQAKQSMLSSFRGTPSDLQFADSPARSSNNLSAPPATPRTLSHTLSKQLKATTSRAEDAELALSALEGEVRALGFSSPSDPASTTLTTIANHFRSIRLDLERLLPGETTSSFQSAELYPELLRKLKDLLSQLHSRDAELRSLRNQERVLRGNFDHALAASGKADAKIKELEKALDTLASEGMETRMRAQDLEQRHEEKDRDVQKLTDALEKYRAEVRRLEELIEKVEMEHGVAMRKVQVEAQQDVEVMEAKVESEATGRRKAEESAVGRLKRIQELERALAQAREYAEGVEARLASSTIPSDQQADTSSTHTSVSKDNATTAPAPANNEVQNLTSRLTSLSTALATATAEIDKLKATNAKLEAQYRTEVAQGEKAVSRMHDELIRAATKMMETGKGYRRGSKVRLANWELESDGVEDEMGLMTPASSVVRFADVQDLEDEGSDEGDEVESQSEGEDAAGADAGDSDGGSESVPGSVRISRGRSHSLSSRRRETLTPEMDATRVKKMKIHQRNSISGRDKGKRAGVLKKGRRKYDSGIGMSSASGSASGSSSPFRGGDSGMESESEGECIVDVDVDVEMGEEISVEVEGY